MEKSKQKIMDINHLTIEELEILIEASKKRIETLKNNKRLFLDDSREVRDVCYYVENPRIYWDVHLWDIVRNYNEFVEYIESNGLPSLISFDHDLADFHYDHPPKEYESLSDEEKMVKFNSSEKTGLDCAKWLVQYCETNNKKLPDFFVHSKNDIGKINIESYLNNAKKNLNI